MTWLHDTESLRGLCEEEGPIAEWARFQCAVRGVTGVPLPTRDLYRGLIAVLGPVGFDGWWAQHREEGEFISLLEHGVAHGVIPEDLEGWVAACRAGIDAAYAEVAANTLIRLGVGLSPGELASASAAAPGAMTLPAWIAAVDPSAAAEVVARVDSSWLSASLSLVLHTRLPRSRSALEAVEEGAAAVGVVLAPAGKGSAKLRLARQLRPLADQVGGVLGALIQGSLDAGQSLSAEVCHGLVLKAGAQDRDPLDRYEAGVFDPIAVAAGRAARTEPLEAGVGIERGMLPPVTPESVFAQQALAARCPGWVPQVLNHEESRHIGLELARFAPTEAVFELLLSQPVPHDEEARFHLAIALVHTGVPVVVAHVRQLAEDLEPAAQAFLDEELQSFFREAL